MKTLEIVKSHKRKLGIIHDHWGPSDLAFLAIHSANRLVENPSLDVILFYKDIPNPCVTPKCALMNICDIWGFDGLTIATDIDSALALSKVPGYHKKVFYVWDLEWLRNKDFLYNVRAYRSGLNLVCKSEEHKLELSKYCNRTDIDVIEDFDLTKFVEKYCD